MSEKLNDFVVLMKSIFELDKADLDFGIYRIMNMRRKQVEQFLSEGLPAQVKEILEPFSEEKTSNLKVRKTEIESICATVGILVENSNFAEEYAEIKSILARGVDTDSIEADVYSALYSFFNRYYDEGDFISKRRYKEGVYAIPYEGEEVKLYWANADQYYIKTAEYFRDYTFVVDGKKVHFKLVDATSEQNNNKEFDSNKRVFMLYTENPDSPDIKTIEEVNGELIIRFVYDTQTEVTGQKIQDKYIEIILATITNEIQSSPNWRDILVSSAGSASGTLSPLARHLKKYVAKNTFDYFIHKDLRGFLTRELDFFIKNEVLHLDDIDVDDGKYAGNFLAKVRAVKRIGKTIIDFLAQIEDFQKKLWLKKKFIVETNWCITLDHIDERFYPEISTNAAQIAEWRDMYYIDEIEGNLETVGYCEPLTEEFLRQNGNLLLDTRHFTSDFKDRLVASIEDLDEQTGGLMIQSENYQALQLLQERYKEQVKCVYIDPPYNTDTAPIMYKNGYKDSTWLSLMDSRLMLTIPFLFNRSVIVIAIDKVEQAKLGGLLDGLFPTQEITMITVQHNPTGQMGDNFAESNQFAYFIYNKIKDIIGKEYRTSERADTRTFRDNSGNSNLRTDAANCFYPIFVKDGKIIGFGDVAPDDYHPERNVHQQGGTIAVYPVDNSNGIEKKWVYERGTVENILSELWVRTEDDGAVEIMRTKSIFRHKTIWADAKYSDNSWGSAILTDLGITFPYPKSINTVIDSVKAALSDEKNGIILDYFAGSGTTGHAVLNLNREDKEKGKRKYVLVEMGEYFNTVTLKRIKKVIYSKDWNKGKPKNRNTGISHIMKYMKLESYEDALLNIKLDNDMNEYLGELFRDDYLINYMFILESRAKLFSTDDFNNPWEYKLNITENNEANLKKVDLCETFNYLIGLSVKQQGAIVGFNATVDNKVYEGSVSLSEGSEFNFKHIEGTLPDGKRVLVIWRTITDDIIRSNAALDAYFTKNRINSADREFDIIYVNCDNNLENLRENDESWIVRRIEPLFKAKMFEEI